MNIEYTLEKHISIANTESVSLYTEMGEYIKAVL
jgi:hypothetical protein